MKSIKTLIVVLLLAVGMLLVACGGTADEPEPTAPAAAPTEAPVAEPEAAPGLQVE